MTGGLRLHKLHGLGNEFIVALVDELPAEADAARTAAALCQRSDGIGADGLIYVVVDPPSSGSGTQVLAAGEKGQAGSLRANVRSP